MCIFCKIISGDIPNKTIMENETFLAFEDINPLRKIHILVIPKKHFSSFTTTPANIIGQMTSFIQELTKKLNLNENGYRLITNIGENGGQEVEHLHFHILGGEKVGKLVDKR